jgi:hypothetical protein
MPVLHLDDKAEHSRGAIELQHRDGFAHAAELITIRVEYPDASEPGNEHPVRAHYSHPQLLTRGRVVGEAGFPATRCRLRVLDG